MNRSSNEITSTTTSSNNQSSKTNSTRITILENGNVMNSNNDNEHDFQARIKRGAGSSLPAAAPGRYFRVLMWQ